MQRLLNRIRDVAGADATRPAFTGPSRTVSYQELLSHVTEISSELEALGVRRLGIYADNSID